MKPLSLCLERTDTPATADRFVQCVAIVGREPALALGADGVVLWADPDRAALELWVSADERLMAFRVPSAPSCTVVRAGRRYAIPEQKPAVLLDADELELGSARLRLHVHGPAPRVSRPMPWAPRRSHVFRAAATAVAVGATFVAASSSRGAPSRGSAPPAQACDAGPGDDGGARRDAGKDECVSVDGAVGPTVDGGVDDAGADGGVRRTVVVPLEVREAPPEPPLPPPAGCCGHQPGLDESARRSDRNRG